MYAADAAITRHLAKFLRNQNSNDKQYGFPQAIMFNGGVFRSEIFRNRLIEVINSWLNNAGKEPIKVLEGIELSQAVARGATYYGIAAKAKASEFAAAFRRPIISASNLRCRQFPASNRHSKPFALPNRELKKARSKMYQAALSGWSSAKQPSSNSSNRTVAATTNSRR
jgi:hypothetical protein